MGRDSLMVLGIILALLMAPVTTRGVGAESVPVAVILSQQVRHVVRWCEEMKRRWVQPAAPLSAVHGPRRERL